MNLPNRLTVSRMLMIPIFMVFAVPFPQWLIEVPVLSALARNMTEFNGFILGTGRWVAGTIFLLAFLTDALDGYIARKYMMVTDFGKFLDPIADKLLVTAAMIALVERQELSSWIAVIIIAREFLVTGIRLLASNQGVVIAAGSLGKLKTVFQTIALAFMLFDNFSIGFLCAVRLDDILMVIALLLTVISGADYLIKNKHLIQNR